MKFMKMENTESSLKKPDVKVVVRPITVTEKARMLTLSGDQTGEGVVALSVWCLQNVIVEVLIKGKRPKDAKGKDMTPFEIGETAQISDKETLREMTVIGILAVEATSMKAGDEKKS